MNHSRNSDFQLLCLLRFFAAMNVPLILAVGCATRYRAIAFGLIWGCSSEIEMEQCECSRVSDLVLVG